MSAEPVEELSCDTQLDIFSLYLKIYHSIIKVGKDIQDHQVQQLTWPIKSHH